MDMQAIVILVYGIIMFGLGFYIRPRYDEFVAGIVEGFRKRFGTKTVSVRGKKKNPLPAEQLVIKKVGEYPIDGHLFDVIVKPPIDDYDRSLYDPSINTRLNGNWSPREQVLIRDSLVTVGLNPEGTKIISGQWKCPYTGVIFLDPRDIEIDHIVPLAESWICGAKHWSNKQRSAFSRDLENLIAVSSIANQQKGRRAPDEWMQMPESYKLTYIRNWINIKKKYNLGMSETEILAMANYAA